MRVFAATNPDDFSTEEEIFPTSAQIPTDSDSGGGGDGGGGDGGGGDGGGTDSGFPWLQLLIGAALVTTGTVAGRVNEQ